MKIQMKYMGDSGQDIFADCEKCGHILKISKDLCEDNGNNNYVVTEKIECDKCGHKSNKISINVNTKNSFDKKEKISFWDGIKKAINNSVEFENAKQAERQRKVQEPIKCPKCGSAQITANKKGFSVGKALVGGLVAGSMGKNKIMITCLKCGHSWKAGKK